ncbi:hypothetical protein [Rhodoferax sp. U11-2br]|uniref:hypothetical protein n=1 Tax=Rhodoferax sp. U11-2br TaxID=2838878 RepID=UPI001BE5B24D|nr:hypothetical protein [Rhodoferax sp. U11-2br]MBT3066718.1 hypothetical protein [Rhodoferax sp. U11-2br]
MTDQSHRLLAIVAVDQAHRVRCQQPHCGHGVYARIHVVEEGGQLLVLGSDCFAKRYGAVQTSGVHGQGGGGGRVLTEAERELLVNNTRALLEQFEAERRRALELAEEKRLQDQAQEAARQKAMVEKLRSLKALSELRSPSSHVLQPDNTRPLESQQTPLEVTPTPAWASLKKEPSSLFAYGVGEGQCWVLIQSATHAGCFIAPAPDAFESWDEALPPSMGRPDLDRQVYVSEKSINELVGWFMQRRPKSSRIDSDPVAIQRYALECAKSVS